MFTSFRDVGSEEFKDSTHAIADNFLSRSIADSDNQVQVIAIHVITSSYHLFDDQDVFSTRQ